MESEKELRLEVQIWDSSAWFPESRGDGREAWTHLLAPFSALMRPGISCLGEQLSQRRYFIIFVHFILERVCDHDWVEGQRKGGRERGTGREDES